MRTRTACLSAFVLFLLALLPAVAGPVQTGSWTKKSFGIAGEWSIVEEQGRRFLVLDDRFKTRSAPDLKLFLSTHALADANGKNATRGSVLIAKLDKAKGGQRYELPDVDLEAYSSLLLHCEQYGKLWGGAPLR